MSALRFIFCLLIAVIIVGCQAYYVLPDGQQSTMSMEATLERSILKIRKVTQYKTLEYAPQKKCEYKEWIHLYGDSTGEKYLLSLTIKAIDENLLVLMERPGIETSSVLMDTKGKILDFNLVDPTDGSRVTSESYMERIAADKTALGDKYNNKRVHFLNPFSVFVPEFTPKKTIRPDQIVAILESEDGAMWGSFIYRGVSQFKNRDVLVVDLVRKEETRPNNGYFVVGFKLLDPSTSLPIYSVTDRGLQHIVENIRCED